jgi:multidrug efflux pump subunit AcrA (membrane-fusion protein)
MAAAPASIQMLSHAPANNCAKPSSAPPSRSLCSKTSSCAAPCSWPIAVCRRPAAARSKRPLASPPSWPQPYTLNPTKSSRSPASRRKRRWALALILGLLSLIPLPFRVGGEARLEARRPFSCYIGTQARVSEILVHDGQIVQAGQVLARLDPRELNFEIRSLERKLSKAQAETQILANQASLSPAHEAERVLAELQQERVAEELRHARSRRRLLELRAPVAGVVVRSGLKGLEGRLFRAGEALCDIAPSTQLRAVVRIPEADFSRVRVGQELELRLRSKPGLAITSPIAELQARIEYDPELGGVLVIRSETIPGTEELRTGMRGTAWVELGWRPAGFILFRRLWTRLRAALLFAG